MTTSAAPSLSIKSQTNNLTATVGQTQNLPQFEVVMNTIPNVELTYQWYESDTNSETSGALILNATHSSYTVPMNTVDQSGTKYYYVKISGNLNGVQLKSITSTPSALTITDKPTIIISQQPIAQNVTVGETENLPSLNVEVGAITDAQLTYQWYSSTNNSSTSGTAIQGATCSSYMIPEKDIGTTATTKYYYVIISGTINGVTLTPVNSNVVPLNIASRPANNIIANSLATAINTLNPNVANFAATQQMQYMAPSYAAQEMLPQIQALIQDVIKKNPEKFNNLSVSGSPIKINPNLVTVIANSASPSVGSDETKNVNKTLSVNISYRTAERENTNLVTEANPSSNVTLAGFNGFSDEQKSKITTWFDQATTQEKLMKNLLDTAQGKTFLANLLNQTFFKFVIKGLGNNFELQSVTLNNNLNFTGITRALSAFVLKIKTTAAAQYSNTPETNSAFAGFSNFQSIPSGSIISFQLPLTFVTPSTSTNNLNIYQPDYVLSSTYTNTTNANPSWVFMNGFGQFNPLISWTLPPYKQSYVTYPTSVGNVGVLGVNKTGNYPHNSYNLSITEQNNKTVNAFLFFRFTQNATQVAYGSNNQLVPFGASYIQMPVFTPTANSASSVFNNIFQKILTLFKSE